MNRNTERGIILRITDYLTLILTILVLLLPIVAIGGPYIFNLLTEKSDLEVSNARVYQSGSDMVDNLRVVSVYMMIENKSDETLHLIDAHTEVAEDIEICDTQVGDKFFDQTHNLSNAIEILPSTAIQIDLENYCLNLTNLVRIPKVDETFPIILKFDSGQSITVNTRVIKP